MIVLFEFLIVAALWGGSYLFMRVAGPAFGVLPLVGLRLSIGGAFLLGLCGLNGKFGEIRRHWKKTVLLGVSNSAVPFSLLAYTTIHTNAGFGAILNSTAPFFTAVEGWVWLRERLRFSQGLGLLIGGLGVWLEVGGRLSFHSTRLAAALAAALMGTLLYGFSIVYTKKYLADVSPLAITTVSQVTGAMVLAPFVIARWPAQSPGPAAWWSVGLLGVFSTAVAFVSFYRLIARLGATRTVVVTYLIPVFGMVWGGLFLGERVTVSMIGSTVVILFGTALSQGVVGSRSP